jgi:hypothetical protein
VRPTELATNHHQSGGDGCVSDVQGKALPCSPLSMSCGVHNIEIGFKLNLGVQRWVGKLQNKPRS